MVWERGGVWLHGTLSKGWRGTKFLQFCRGSLKITIEVLLKDCEHWPGGSYIRNRGDGANSLKSMLVAFLPRASGEEAVIESNKSQPIYIRRGEQAGLLATEPRGRQKPLRSVRKNVLDVWEERERSDR